MGISNKIKGVIVTASVSPLVDLGSILLSMEKKVYRLLRFFGGHLLKFLRLYKAVRLRNQAM